MVGVWCALSWVYIKKTFIHWEMDVEVGDDGFMVVQTVKGEDVPRTPNREETEIPTLIEGSNVFV